MQVIVSEQYECSGIISFIPQQNIFKRNIQCTVIHGGKRLFLKVIQMQFPSLKLVYMLHLDFIFPLKNAWCLKIAKTQYNCFNVKWVPLYKTLSLKNKFLLYKITYIYFPISSKIICGIQMSFTWPRLVCYAGPVARLHAFHHSYFYQRSNFSSSMFYLSHGKTEENFSS